VLASVRGTFEGRIGQPPRVPAGAAGFGYDPLFLVAPGFEKTSAELTPEAKNLISHRSAAAGAMSAEVGRLFS
jgi:XTP/dITP diphosphohydrolase